MSEWQYTPIENIAFALQDIANTLERIEKLMPVPGGEITSSEIWVNKLVEQVEENPQMQEALADADAKDEEDDLPELS